MWITVKKSWNPCRISKKRRFTSSSPLSTVFHGFAPDRASPIVLSCWAAGLTGLAGWLSCSCVCGATGLQGCCLDHGSRFFCDVANNLLHCLQAVASIVFKPTASAALSNSTNRPQATAFRPTIAAAIRKKLRTWATAQKPRTQSTRSSARPNSQGGGGWRKIDQPGLVLHHYTLTPVARKRLMNKVDLV